MKVFACFYEVPCKIIKISSNNLLYRQYNGYFEHDEASNMILNTFLESRVCVVWAHLADLFLHPWKVTSELNLQWQKIESGLICKVLKKFNFPEVT